MLNIYVCEAHAADDVFPLNSNREDGIDYAQPTTVSQRLSIANDMKTYWSKVNQETYDSTLRDIPLLLDGMDNTLAKAYEARPLRMFVVDARTMKIAYLSGVGPFQHDLDEVLEFFQKHSKTS
mmetsp:Transcript_6989/g.14608  ORF Transcript_6989/g.14608 Transcript_6989/m.14608 type:complete len:123 (-) Transcript_6989:110-478(-)